MMNIILGKIAQPFLPPPCSYRISSAEQQTTTVFICKSICRKKKEEKNYNNIIIIHCLDCIYINMLYILYTTVQ